MVRSIVLLSLSLLQEPATASESPTILHERWRLGSANGIAIMPSSKALASADGSFWISLPTNCALVHVRAGRVNQRVGGCGTGPGQFRSISSVGLYHDSLWVWDRAIGRLTVFAPSGHKVVRLVRLDFSRTAFRGRDVPAIGALIEGNSVLVRRPS